MTDSKRPELPAEVWVWASSWHGELRVRETGQSAEDFREDELRCHTKDSPDHPSEPSQIARYVREDLASQTTIDARERMHKAEALALERAIEIAGLKMQLAKADEQIARMNGGVFVRVDPEREALREAVVQAALAWNGPSNHGEISRRLERVCDELEAFERGKP